MKTIVAALSLSMFVAVPARVGHHHRVVCDTSQSRETAQAIVASLGDEMLIAVNRAERPGWPASGRQ